MAGGYLCRRRYILAVCTREELRNYKSMQSYQIFIAGWVREILVKDIGDKRVVISKVCLYILLFS